MNHLGQLALIALGSNTNNKHDDVTETVANALVLLSKREDTQLIQSRFFTSPAFPIGNGPDFVNAAAAFSTQLSAQQLLAELHEIEADAGRVRDVRWAPRTLDLDLLALGDQIAPDAATFTHWRNLPLARQMQETPSELILPHPRLQDRAFVLLPLADVAPNWTHPSTGRTVLEMLEALPLSDRSAVVPFT